MKKKLLNELVVSQNQKQAQQKSAKDYRDAILFDEIIRTQKKILLYDCKGKIYRHNVYLNWGAIILATGLFTLFVIGDKYQKDRLWYCLPCVLFALTRLRIYRDFQKTYVEKIIYNTEDKKIEIIKRNFFAKQYSQLVNKNHLLYTQDEYLNSKNINYINMDSLECYQIGFKYAWVNQQLFSHLLEQRISSIKSKA